MFVIVSLSALLFLQGILLTVTCYYCCKHAILVMNLFKQCIYTGKTN